MDVAEKKLKELLIPNSQFIAPSYQRRYVWEKRQWQDLWKPILRLAQTEGPIQDGHSSYFIGSFVVVQRPSGPGEATKWEIVDGQQRLTTLMILLAVARDLSGEAEGKKYDDLYLRNPFLEADDATARWRLRLTASDEASLSSVFLSDQEAMSSAGGALVRCREFFATVLSEAEQEGVELHRVTDAVVSQLDLVTLTCGPDDNVHRIFQTLNASGISLGSVDLIRNHVFMLIPGQERAEEVYEEVWRPMEEQMGGAKGLEKFFVADTRRREGGVPEKRVYEEISARLNEIEGQPRAVEELLRKAKAHSGVFSRYLQSLDLGDELVTQSASRLREWDAVPTYPVVLQVLADWNDQRISAKEAQETFGVLESFLVRRLLAGVPSNLLQRILSEAANALYVRSTEVDQPPKAYAELLREILSVSSSRWPNDEVLQAELPELDFYTEGKSSQRQFILRRIAEEFGGDPLPDWASGDIQVEHIMPRTLSAEWISDLQSWETDLETSESVDLMHGRFVHKLGNLTLTTINSKLSNKSFEVKKQDLEDAGPIKMNQEIIEEPEWTSATITARTAELLGIVLQIWPGPNEAVRNRASSSDEILVALNAVPEGHWITRKTLENVVLLEPHEIDDVLSSNQELWHKAALVLMNNDGGVDESKPWNSFSDRGPQEVLFEAGVLETVSSSVAIKEKELDESDLVELIEVS